MGRRIFAAVLTASVGALGALACVGDPEIGGSSLDSGADAGGTDAGATDASTVDANKESLNGSLFGNGDFERGCDGWGGEDATLTEESTGRTGKGCRVCGNGGQQYFYIGQALEGALVPGTTYVARAWVRATTDKPSHKVEVVMNTTNSGDMDVDYKAADPVPIGSEFTKIEAALEIKAASPCGSGPTTTRARAASSSTTPRSPRCRSEPRRGGSRPSPGDRSRSPCRGRRRREPHRPWRRRRRRCGPGVAARSAREGRAVLGRSGT